MPPEIAALATLLLYLALAGWAVWRDMRRCRDGWRLWLLHVIARSYTSLVFRLRIRQRCPFPVEESALLIVNHRSPVDPILVFATSSFKRDGYRIRRLEFLTASEFCNPGGFPGFVTRTMHVIPVDRDGRDMGPVKEALRRLKDGRLVGVFPEGRINDRGDGSELLPASPGIAWLALHSKVPVYPVFIQGSPQGRNMITPFYTFARVGVVYGPPVDLSNYYGRRITQELLQEVTALLMRRLARLGNARIAEAAPRVRPETVPMNARVG